MTPILSPEAIEALKWIDQFGDSRPVPAAFDDVVYALLNDGLIYQAAADRVLVREVRRGKRCVDDRDARALRRIARGELASGDER